MARKQGPKLLFLAGVLVYFIIWPLLYGTWQKAAYPEASRQWQIEEVEEEKSLPPPDSVKPEEPEQQPQTTEAAQEEPNQRSQVPSTPDRTLVVEGPEWFRVQMLASLDLLRQKDPENYFFVLDHLDVIRPGERSEVDVLTKTFCRKPSGLRRPTILESWIFGAGRDYETIEEAAILVHEAAHVYLFEQGEKFSGEEGEAWAINRQLQCLERLEAPYWMKIELPLAYETHYWEIPREERNW
ncbi:MAG: hypothetical protein K6U74_04860 [Firmicutes bacterium]|nr:hypothetical protein [Bacillota bacterium]